MGLLHHLLAHAALHKRQHDLKKLQKQVQKHQDDDERARKEAVVAQARMNQLHKALKLNHFGRQLNEKVGAMQNAERKVQVHALVRTIASMQENKKKLESALLRKNVEHAHVQKRLESMRAEINDAISVLEKLKKGAQ
jgi:predicted  nucleic acid-binding Zn-ribbon protein